MKKITVLIAVVMFVLGLGINNIAVSNMTGTKIAVVDVQTVVSKSAQVKALKKEQEKNMKDLEKWLTTARADIDKQQTKEGKEKLIKKYDTDFVKKKENIAKNYSSKLQEIDKNITATISEKAKAQGYDIVLTKGAVLYGGKDITEEIAKAVK